MYIIETTLMIIVAIITIVATLILPKFIEIKKNRFMIPIGIIAFGIISSITFIIGIYKLGKITNFDIYGGLLIDIGAVYILFILLKEYNLIKPKENKKTPKKKNNKKVKLHSEDEKWDCIE